MSEIVLSDFDLIKVSGTSRRILAYCLWHEQDGGDGHRPSMMVYHDGFFKCLGCGVQGGFNKLYAKMNEVKGTTGLKSTSSRGGQLPLLPTEYAEQSRFYQEAHAHLQTHSSLRYYLDERRLSDQINAGLMGYYDEMIILPVIDHQVDRVRGLVARCVPNKAKRLGLRYVTPRGQPALLYVPDPAKLLEMPAIFVVFGMFDAWTLNKLGYAAVTTTAGKDSFDPSWLDDYRKPIVIVEDQNEGNAAIRPAMTRGLDWRYKHLALEYPAGIKDPNDFLMQYRESELIAQLDKVRLTSSRRVKK